VVYTLWMKRRSPWSVVWGGIAGAVPILAGRALALDAIDAAGIALCLSVFLWIPTHILTFSLRYESDYRRARIPTMPQRYGDRATRLAISLSSLGAAMAMTFAALQIGMGPGYLRLLGVLGLGLVGLALRSALRPSASLNFALFKYASVFMLSGMIVIVLETMA
ncbi:MAG: UbiA family prenyltransferase, partial [Anaerolineales bacterium]|nr:UbiA family prenyltransferase [Anaerolineales bacterium]